MVKDIVSGLTNTVGSITNPSAGDGNKFLGNGNGNGNGNGQGNGVRIPSIFFFQFLETFSLTRCNRMPTRSVTATAMATPPAMETLQEMATPSL